jgi:hypothetical protein
MPLSLNQTTFRRIQTDDPTAVTVFFSVDATDALGRVVAGPMEAITMPLTGEQLTFAAGLVEHARMAYVAQKNAELAPEPEPTP